MPAAEFTLDRVPTCEVIDWRGIAASARVAQAHGECLTLSFTLDDADYSAGRAALSRHGMGLYVIRQGRVRVGFMVCPKPTKGDTK